MNYKWYIVNAISGCENSVCNEINKIALSNEFIKEAFIPTKKAFKILKGKKVEVEQKLFPAYVFVNMVCNNSTLEIIRNISKVMGFLGPKFNPNVVSDEEIVRLREKMLTSGAVDEDIFEIGDTIKIIDGPFESFIGTIDMKDDEKRTLKISVSIFGRATIVDIDYSKVEKV